MDIKTKRIFFFLLFFIFLFFALSSNAALDFNSPSEIATVQDLTDNIVNWFLGVAGLLIVLFLIIGGIYYITAAGDENQMGEAKKIINYAVIGLIVMLMSYSIITTLNDIIFG